MANASGRSSESVDLESALKEAAGGDGGEITCPRAFALARRLGVPPAAVGAAADDLGVRVQRCQLGLFGYGSKAEGKSKIVKAIDPVPPALAERLRTAAGDAGAVTCAEVWEVARQAHTGRLAVAGAAQGLDIHISECQLGCFKPRPPARR